MEFWPTNGWPVTEAKANQILPQVNREVYVWQDGRRDPIPNDNQDDENIYCQTPGTCTGGTEMLWRDMFAKWSPGEDAQNFRFVADPEDGSTFVVWDEIRYPYNPNDPYRIVFIQKLDKDGVPRWSNAGVAVNKYNCGDCECSPYAQLPDVCIDGAGGARVVWQQTEGAYQACWAAQVQADGTVLFNNSIWASNCYRLSGNFTEPRIVVVNGTNLTAAIGVLQQASSGVSVPRHCSWNNSNVIAKGTVVATGITDHTDLRISFDGDMNEEGMYSLTRSSAGNGLSIIHYNLVNFTPPFFKVNESIIPVAFGGYDLTTSTIAQPVKKPAYFTWSEKAAIGSPFEVNLGYFHPAGGLARRNITSNSAASTPPQKPDSKQPVLVCDSIAAYGTHEGVLLAWDTEVYQSGGGELSLCLPPRPTDIMGQYVLYAAGAGAQWAGPQSIAPGPGDYHQTRPQVQSSLPGAVSVYWYDGQTGDASVMGTRMPNLHATIAWAKAVEEDRQAAARAGDFRVESIWPQPASQSTDAVHVFITGERGESVSVEVYDLLGRKRAMLHDGLINEQGIVLTLSPSQLGLGPGSYILLLRSSQAQVTQKFSIIR